MNFKNVSVKLLAVVMTVAMMLGVCAPTISAAGKFVDGPDAESDKNLNYVSIGDSMANGYCFEGYKQGSSTTSEYDFLSGKNVYGVDAYPLQFEKYLEEKGYDVNHTKLATSAMLADDLLYLLGGRDEEFDDGWNGYRDYDGSATDEQMKAHFQNAITEADIITLGIGNASFGAFLVDRMTSAMGVLGGSLDEDEKVTLEDALAILESEEAKEIVLDIYNDMKAELLPLMSVLPDKDMGVVLDVFAYTVASHLVSYEAVLDKIVELNPDVEVVLVGLMNTTYGLEINVDGMDPIAIGDMMDESFGLLNAYMAGLPAAKQLSGEYAEAKFYYAEQPEPKFICQVFEELMAANWGKIQNNRLDGQIVRKRNVDAYNDALFPMVSPMFNDMLPLLGLDGASLSTVNLTNVNNYVVDDQFDIIEDFMSEAEKFGIAWATDPAFKTGLMTEIYGGNKDDVVAFLEGKDLVLIARYYNEYEATPDETELTKSRAMALFAPEIGEELSILVYLAIEEAVAKTSNLNQLDVDGLLGLVGGNPFSALGGAPTISGFAPEVIKGDLVAWLTATPAGRSMCKIYGLFKVGNGMSVHPTPEGHDEIAKAVIAAYENGHTAQDETVKNLLALSDLLLEYYDEAYAFAYDKAVEDGVIDQVEAYLDEATAAIDNAEDTLNNSGYIRSPEFTAEATAAFADARATVEALRALIKNADELDAESYEYMLALLDTLLVNLEDIGALLEIAVVDFGHYVDPMIVELNEQAKAQIEALRAAVEAEIAELRAAVEAEIAALRAEAEAQIAALRAEAEAQIAALKAQLETAVGEAKAAIEAEIARIEAELAAAIAKVEAELEAAIAALEAEIAAQIAKLEADLEAAIEAVKARTEEEIIKLQAAVEALIADIDALNRAVKAAIEGTTNAVNGIIADANKYLKENLPEAYDKLVALVLAQIPEADKYLYDWFYNNPEVVIGFFAEHGDDMAAFLVDNADVIGTILGFIAYNYGEDILNYVIDNADVLLPAFVSWYEAYGDRVWDILGVYLNALGVTTDIFDLDSIYSALNNLAALIAQLGGKLADDAWDKLIESGILEDILESIENVKAEAYAKIAYLENELRAQLQLQLNTLEAELAALNAKLEAAIAAGNAALAAQLKAAIAELEAAIAQVKAELAKIDAMINEVKAAVEELIAAVERIEAIVNKIVDVIESNANLDAILPVIKEALKDLNSALIDAINAAALVEKLETALKVLVAEGVDACVNYLKAVGTEVANEVAAALEAIAKAALKQLADAIEAELAVLGAKLNAALKIFIEGALTSDYIRTEDSYYLAIGSDPDYFAQLLAEKLNLKDSFGAINWNEITPESIAMADLISISYNENELSAFAISQAFGYAADYVNYDLKNDVLAYIDAAFDEFAHNSAASSAIKPEVIAAMKAAVIASVTGAIDQTSADVFGDATKAEMDWAGIVGAENLQYVNKAREEMKNAIADANVPEFYTQKINVIDLFYENLDMLGEYKAVIDMFEPEYIRGCFGEYEEYTVKVPVADALAFAGESYAFSVAQLSKSYAETIMMINKVNPDATVVLLGHYNAFDGVALGDVDLSEVYGAFAKACGVLPFGYALLADNVVFVDISEAETVFGAYAEGGEFTALDFFMFYALDPTITSVSEAGHAYIAEKIFAALNITCEHVDNNNDHNCDLCDAVLSECADEDKDHKCDVCDAVLSDCADADKDHNCDYCGAELGECADTDKDHKCDYCGETLSECADTDKDHKCDYCGATLSDCADDDKDHNCDYCGATLSECVDTDNDKKCDYCGEAFGECEDKDNDHYCDYCGEKISECLDLDIDHYCDICGATLSECADADKDHNCDYCGAVLGDCADADKDHKCDYCGATLSECADADKDHNCDYCGAEISKCADANKDHKCDVCGEELSKCVDNDHNHKCDLCGATLSKCEDADKDHKCDYCGETLSECADADKNHKCDLCGATLSECADANKDHKCDLCGAVLSECADANKDHKCDLCGVELSKCDDANKDHNCDYCGAELSKCDDANKDHKCDLCGAVLSECADADKDHKCDYCGATLSECADADKDHKCDYCGATLGECADADKNHKCDICGATLSECADADKDHKCDYCGAVLSKCDDADKDHKCDYCGAVLSECADVVKNHKCDYCGATLSECADENNDHKCEYCGNTVSEHKWADATCKAPKTCEICGKTEGKVADHQYGDWETVKEATKKEEGEQKKTCKVCGDTVTEAIPMLEKSSAAPIITAVVIVVVAGLGTAFVVLKKKKIF